jgi:hypothetical protein
MLESTNLSFQEVQDNVDTYENYLQDNNVNEYAQELSKCF